MTRHASTNMLCLKPRSSTVAICIPGRRIRASIWLHSLATVNTGLCAVDREGGGFYSHVLRCKIIDRKTIIQKSMHIFRFVGATFGQVMRREDR